VDTATPAPTPTNTPEPTETPAYIEEKDIVFGKGGDIDLKLNLARPSSGNGPFPALIFLFGGGFARGSREYWRPQTKEAAERGYVAITVDYRLTRKKENGQTKYPFPAQIQDAKCAVRWLRANAGHYQIDPNRIGAVGFSAGGNLALMLGLTDPSDGLEGDCGDATFSSRVQAVVNLAGPTDMVLNYQSSRGYMEALLQGTPEQRPERYKNASPVTYVDKDDPPVLSICGTRDVILSQVEMLDERMKAVGALHTLIVKEDVDHSCYDLANFFEDDPAWDFLDKHLKNVGE
jgi:acetyl esterase/lipase